MLHYFFLVFDRVMSLFWTTYCFPRHPSVPTFSVHSKCLFNRYSRLLSIFSCGCYCQVFSQTLQGYFLISSVAWILRAYVRKIYVRKWNRGNAWNFARQRESWNSVNYVFKLSAFYLASSLFTWLKFAYVNVHGEKRVSWNQPFPRTKSFLVFILYYIVL